MLGIKGKSQVPEYSPELFVDRDDAIAIVEDKVLKIWRGENEPQRVVIFRGYRGAGKSWLLQHLAKTILPAIPGVCPICVNLENFSGRFADDTILTIIGEIGEAVQRYSGEQPDVSFLRRPSPLPLDAAAAWLSGKVDWLAQRHVLVLLVDYVYESKADLLELLEKHVLGLLVTKDRVVLVMAGRGQAYRWKSVALWLEGKDVELKPFDREAYTREQLEKLEQDKRYARLVRGAAEHAEEIHEKTGGYPLSNVFVACDPQPSVRAMKRLMDLLLEPLESLRREDGSLPEREYLQALCVLRAFDEERIPVMLDAYEHKKTVEDFDVYFRPDGIPAPGWTCERGSEVLRGLINTKLVRWKQDAGGWWIVDQTIRELLEEYLRVSDNERWRCCHQTAINLYGDWEKRYKEERSRWDDEIKYHNDRLNREVVR